MPFTDSHCHLASHRFDRAEVPAMLDHAASAGVHRVVTLATSLKDLAANLDIAKDPRVHACIGIHPCEVATAPDDVVDQLSQHLADPRVCAIGETGLDYYHPAPDGWSDAAYRERQRDFLRRHFEMAARSGLNVVIHTRDRSGHESFDDALAIYQDYRHATRALFHCFGGTPEHARRVFACGGIVSFGGTTTFKSAHAVRETLVACPAGSFLLETDSPYLAPEPHRGSRNEPAHVGELARRAATTRNETLESLAGHTESACEAFFRFHPVMK